MKYNVRVEPTAQRDIQLAYDWGKETWGVKQANKWSRELAKVIRRLGEFPERYPLAQENEEFKIEVRQVIFHRYRVLYTIKNEDVAVLHVRGA
jgi:plasmid stabilization system protein ParE